MKIRRTKKCATFFGQPCMRGTLPVSNSRGDVFALAGKSELTVKPRNTVALVGDRVILRCATDRRGEGRKISWTFGTQEPKCRARGDHCDLVIDSVQTSDAGGYECYDESRTITQASLVVIGN